MELELQESVGIVVLLGALTPFLTAILTRLRDPDWFKGLVSLTSAVVIGAVASAVESDGLALEETLQNAGAVWIVHLMSYFGLTKDMVERLAKATVGFAPVAMRR